MKCSGKTSFKPNQIRAFSCERLQLIQNSSPFFPWVCITCFYFIYYWLISNWSQSTVTWAWKCTFRFQTLEVSLRIWWTVAKRANEQSVKKYFGSTFSLPQQTEGGSVSYVCPWLKNFCLQHEGGFLNQQRRQDLTIACSKFICSISFDLSLPCWHENEECSKHILIRIVVKIKQIWW